MTQAEAQYPVQFSVDYPDRELNRTTTAFRIIFIIPIVIVPGSHQRYQRPTTRSL